MKVKQFLNGFLYASSSIMEVTVGRRGHEETLLIGCLVDPMEAAEGSVYSAELNSTLDSFRISENKMTIYSH